MFDLQTVRINPVFRHLTRLCLVSAFFIVAIRMSINWTEQLKYLETSMGFKQSQATDILFFLIAVQLIGSAMILFRVRVFEACFALIIIVSLQAWAFGYSKNPFNTVWNLGLNGALLIAAAESFDPLHPEIGDKAESVHQDPNQSNDSFCTTARNALLLSGRIFLLFAFHGITHKSFKLGCLLQVFFFILVNYNI
jgi:hypothetical protein